jgi:hypothetical protein
MKRGICVEAITACNEAKRGETKECEQAELPKQRARTRQAPPNERENIPYGPSTVGVPVKADKAKKYKIRGVQPYLAD